MTEAQHTPDDVTEAAHGILVAVKISDPIRYLRRCPGCEALVYASEGNGHAKSCARLRELAGAVLRDGYHLGTEPATPAPLASPRERETDGVSETTKECTNCSRIGRTCPACIADKLKGRATPPAAETGTDLATTFSVNLLRHDSAVGRAFSANRHECDAVVSMLCECVTLAEKNRAAPTPRREEPVAKSVNTASCPCPGCGVNDGAHADGCTHWSATSTDAFVILAPSAPLARPAETGVAVGVMTCAQYFRTTTIGQPHDCPARAPQ